MRLNRELLRTATYAPVKRLSQLHEGVKVLTAQVIVKDLRHGVLQLLIYCLRFFSRGYSFLNLLLKVTLVIISFLTNCICDDLDEDSAEGSIDQSLTKILTDTNGVFNLCQSFPQVRFFLSPPNLRTKPTWYPRLRPLVLRVLHQFMLSCPPNLMMLDDFCGDLDPDCVHFTLLAGINFVQSMVDQVESLLAKPPSNPVIR